MDAVPVTYILRTCDKDRKGYGGFQWPKSGPVACPDWSPVAECGHGLHGLLMGVGGSGHLSRSPDAVWQVAEVVVAEIVDLGDKVKFPRAVVVYSGCRDGAVAHIVARGADPSRVVYGTATAGHYGTATAGHYGTATAGVSGTATAGHYGTATAGDGGTATAGDGGTATAGVSGTVAIKWWDGAARRYRTAIGYPGENGILPNVAYRLTTTGAFVAKDPK